MAKLELQFKLPDVVIKTDDGHGCIEAITVNGKDYADYAVADFVLAVIGHGAINDAMALQQAAAVGAVHGHG